MNARLYDPKLHRFLAPDNFIQDPSNSQNYNRYGYVFNNPLIYTDPTGEYAIVDDIIAAVIGGVINLGVNIYQGNIKGDFWEVLGKGSAAFGAGAFSGWTALYPQFGGWLAGGAVVGATNSWLSGEDPVQGAVFGAVSGAVGGAIGSWAASGLSVAIQGLNISSPVLQGALGGGTVGGIMNVGSAVISGADFSDAMGSFGQGFAMGAVTGAVSGAGGGYAAARQNGINPWTRKAIGSPAVDKALMPSIKKLDAQIRTIADEYQIASTQKYLGDKFIVDKYYNQMLQNKFDTSKGGAGFIYEGKTFLSDGNHRMNAAIRYKIYKGNDIYEIYY